MQNQHHFAREKAPRMPSCIVINYGSCFWSARLLIVISVSPITQTHAASLVFSDDFETGSTQKWTKDGVRNLCPVVKTAVDGALPHSGNSMAECNWDGTAAWDAPTAYTSLLLPSWNYDKEFMIRFWVRTAADCARSFGAKFLRLFPDGGKIDEVYFAFMLQTSQAPMMTAWRLNNVATPTFWGGTTSFSDHGWHKVEIYLKHNDVNASNGLIRVWYDGTLQQEIANAVTVAPNAHWSSLYLMSNWSNNGPDWLHGANNHVDWDDVEVYSDIGNSATGLMSDASVSQTTLASRAKNSANPQPPSSITVK